MTVNGSFFDKIRPFWDIQYTFWHPTAVDLKSQFLTIFLTKISKNLNEIREDHFSIWYDHFGPSESVSEWFWWCSKKVDFWPFLLCFLHEKWPFRTIRGQISSANDTQLTVRRSLFDKIRPFWAVRRSNWHVLLRCKKRSFLAFLLVFLLGNLRVVWKSSHRYRSMGPKKPRDIHLPRVPVLFMNKLFFFRHSKFFTKIRVT